MKKYVLNVGNQSLGRFIDKNVTRLLLNDQGGTLKKNAKKWKYRNFGARLTIIAGVLSEETHMSILSTHSSLQNNKKTIKTPVPIFFLLTIEVFRSKMLKMTHYTFCVEKTPNPRDSSQNTQNRLYLSGSDSDFIEPGIQSCTIKFSFEWNLPHVDACSRSRDILNLQDSIQLPEVGSLKKANLRTCTVRP